MNAQTPIAAESLDDVSRRSRSLRLRPILLIAGPVLVLAGALWFYLSSGRYESTDNASLQTGLVAISPSIAGRVTAVEVHENQHVKKGDVLFRIESDTYLASVRQAEADLADARSSVGSLQADYQEAQSDISAAEARYDFSRSEAARQRSLLREGISSRAQADQADTNVRTAREAIAAARAKAESLSARLPGNSADAQPAVQSAAAKLNQARIGLAYTVVRAPQDGVVTRVNQLQVGNYVQPGRPVFMMTGLTFWVQANFKEDQLSHMRVGQPAKVTVDAFPDRPLKGHVQSFSPGTGSSFSVLPAENATGNWVKVVQRLPVQVSIDDAPRDLPLSAGLSANVEVDTGHERHLFGPDTAVAATK
jgi:membrane fusion protein (multidrug efflux system)